MESGISLMGLNSLDLLVSLFYLMNSSGHGQKSDKSKIYCMEFQENQTGIEKRKTLNTFKIQGFNVGPDGLEPPTL